MMVLYVKLGTMPGSHMQVLGKRKLPVVGDRFCVRELRSNGMPERYGRKIRVLCDDIREVRGLVMYMLARF